MRLLQGIFVCSLCLLVLFGGCRRNRPSLVDRNEAPETELWSVPPDSSEYEYLVHLYWRGRDNDGVVERYIWTIQDTLVTDATSWNPAERLRDYRTGRITTQTDSIFSFTAFKNVGGVGLKKNRQAFYIAAIDDNGIIDPDPAAVEFVATIEKLPEIAFTVYINGGERPYSHREVPRDTVGMAKPFAVSYRGTTQNGEIRGYKWFPLSTTITLPGANMWTTDLTDTLRSFTNAGTQKIPSSTFRLVASCLDDANAESRIDAGQFRAGVCQVVVNFDPETEFDGVKNYYLKDDVMLERDIDFTDAIPDTVPFRSWVWLRYAAWDDNRDVITCSPLNSDRCIDFQIQFARVSARVAGSSALSGWLPRGSVHDSDTLSAADSNSVNIGTVEYDFFVRGVDENARPDGTPPRVSIVGNYDPTLNNVTLSDHLGNQVDISPGVVDTLTWNFWKGIGWPYTSPLDTIDTQDPTFPWIKRFSFSIQATGSDHPDDPAGSGVKAWRYLVYDDAGNFWPLARAGSTWISGSALNTLNDKFQLTFRYPSNFGGATGDRCGETVFANLPAYMNRDLTVFLIGRDTAVDEGEFDQYVHLSDVPDGTKGAHLVTERRLVNAYPIAEMGRYTAQREFTFHFRMIREPNCP